MYSVTDIIMITISSIKLRLNKGKLLQKLVNKKNNKLLITKQHQLIIIDFFNFIAIVK